MSSWSGTPPCRSLKLTMTWGMQHLQQTAPHRRASSCRPRGRSWQTSRWLPESMAALPMLLTWLLRTSGCAASWRQRTSRRPTWQPPGLPSGLSVRTMTLLLGTRPPPACHSATSRRPRKWRSCARSTCRSCRSRRRGLPSRCSTCPGSMTRPCLRCAAATARRWRGSVLMWKLSWMMARATWT